MALLSVTEALTHILADVRQMPAEQVDLFSADGRVLAEDVVAKRTQPPFSASAMDGFAVRAADVAAADDQRGDGLGAEDKGTKDKGADRHVRLRIVGQSAAGHGFRGKIAPGECVRIFTGAPLPEGADAVIIQENTTFDADTVTILDTTIDPGFVRPEGGDFRDGQELIAQGRVLTARDVTLAAAAGYGRLWVRRRPVVAILATGDELVLPGEALADDQIVCSNPFGVAALAERAGGHAKFLGIAKDTRSDLRAKIEMARDADILITIGGASVGDHDLVAPVLGEMGLSLAFWKIGMRPGKPLMFGQLDGLRVLGVPGNPVSSLICARLFLVPLIHACLGREDVSSLATAQGKEEGEAAVTAEALSANGARAH